MSDKKYNVWYPKDKRWTNGAHKTLGQQSQKNPHRLSPQEADIYRTDACCGSTHEFEIREVLADGSPGDLWHPLVEVPMAPIRSATAAPINDHVCPACWNDKCSKTEKSCWKCGSPL
jgi:hypothetical protein